MSVLIKETRDGVIEARTKAQSMIKNNKNPHTELVNSGAIDNMAEWVIWLSDILINLDNGKTEKKKNES